MGTVPELIDEPPIWFAPNRGVLPPEHILGRDRIIDRYWRQLQGGESLLLLAPRRIGKTSITTLIHSRAPSDFVVSYVDVEGCKSGHDFINLTSTYANRELERGKTHRIKELGFWAARRIKKVAIRGIEIDVSTQVEARLRRMLDDMDAACTDLGLHVVLIWDEMPWYIDKIAKAGKHEDAIAILDGLRSYRQQHKRSRIRMIYTGSIGFFEVLDRLKQRTQYASRPANDMSLEEVPLLDSDGARELVAALVWGIKRDAVLEKRFVDHTAERCEGHPYIIQWVAQELCDIPPNQSISPDDVDRILTKLVTSDSDPLDLEHYVKRLEELGWGNLARKILNVVAPRGVRGATLAELDNLLPDTDRDQITDVVKMLARDGYATRAEQRVTFCVQLLARWWTHRHALTSA